MAHGTVAMVLALIGIAGAGFATVAMPLITGTQQTASGSNSITTLTTTLTHAVTNPYQCYRTQTYGNMTWTENPCARWPLDFTSGAQANGTLDSPQVQAFIKNAYEYHLVYFSQKIGDASHAQAIINVTGTQVVKGSWTTGYQVSYVGNSLLNVTVARIGSSYGVTHLSAYKLSDRHTSLAFNASQQRAIGSAASDSKAEHLMAGRQYYVVFVSPLEDNHEYVGPQCAGYNGNSSVVVRSYDVQFDQVNGYTNVQVYVDGSFNVLSRTISNQPYRSLTGYGSGLIITDPWISGYADSQQGPSCPQ